MPGQRQASVIRQYGFEQYGNLLLKYTTQAEGLEVARRLTAEGRPYHMTSRQETIDLIETKPDKVIRQKVIESVVLTSEVSKYGGPVAINLDYDYGRLLVLDFHLGYRGWVVLAPGANNARHFGPSGIDDAGVVFGVRASGEAAAASRTTATLRSEDGNVLVAKLPGGEEVEQNYPAGTTFSLRKLSRKG
ncbi:MAG: hypothetical protein M1160_01000 [Candidatus Marsarchaeota archaeon]|nr:hypothetical protein [Candidatus Marsarchaeota archaeon]MCL5111445.1 hypothetical protein [Candidatus Marsarchaeota archaeon]